MFLSAVHNHGPAPSSESDGASRRSEGCTFTLGLLSQHRVLGCNGEQWLR